MKTRRLSEKSIVREARKKVWAEHGRKKGKDEGN
jgi:hypothetical protein